MDRRLFGQRVLSAAAALGLRSISAPWLVGCSSDADPSDDTLDAGTGKPAAMDAGTPSRGLDAMVQRQADAGGTDAGTQVMHEALVIGSGYGSAVTALRLTQRGIPVTMLEMGRLWDKPGADGKVFCNAISPDDRAMWFREQTATVVSSFLGLSVNFPVPKSAGALAVLGNDDMEVSCGRGFGGGSLVNLAMYITPVKEVFERTLPSVDADEMFNKFFPRARAGLQVNACAMDFFESAECTRYARVSWETCEAAGFPSTLLESGYDYNYMAQEDAGLVPRSATGGEALYGNNHGKRSLDKSYLAEAMGTGLLTVHTLHRAKRIEQESDGSYTVTCEVIALDGTVREANKQMHTRHLFLGAGCMGTSELLVRARDTGTLPMLNQHVGTAWGPNSDIFVARSLPIWQPTGTVATAVPPAGFRTLDQDGKHVFSMHLPLPVGIETYSVMNIVMTESPEAGSFRYDASTDTVKLVWELAQAAPAVKSARFLFDKVNRVNGSTYRGDLFGGREIGDRATYHPLGGCPLGRATDDYGRLPGYAGLYVVDGSLIPVGIGANPSLTITALAERNIERVLAEDFGV